MPRLILAGIFLISLNLTAQDSSRVPVPTDSVSPVNLNAKDPNTAVLLSLPLPGLGQFYNEQYWKVPLFTGVSLVSVYFFFQNNADFNNTSVSYDNAIQAGADQIVISRLYNQKEAFRDNRDLWAFAFVTTYILAAVDAYVGAHLYSFDVGDDLSMSIGPSHSQILALNVKVQL